MQLRPGMESNEIFNAYNIPHESADIEYTNRIFPNEISVNKDNGERKNRLMFDLFMNITKWIAQAEQQPDFDHKTFSKTMSILAEAMIERVLQDTVESEKIEVERMLREDTNREWQSFKEFIRFWIMEQGKLRMQNKLKTPANEDLSEETLN